MLVFFPHYCDQITSRNSLKEERISRAHACRGFMQERHGDLQGSDNMGLGLFPAPWQVRIRDPWAEVGLGHSPQVRSLTSYSSHPDSPNLQFPQPPQASFASWNQVFKHKTVADTQRCQRSVSRKNPSGLGRVKFARRVFRQKMLSTELPQDCQLLSQCW